MGYRIGVASSDGKVVNEHFGRATQFTIIDVDDEQSIQVVELRKVTPFCQGGNHDEDQLEAAVKNLEDCKYLIVARIGQGAQYALEQHGIEVFELPMLIEDAVKKLIAYIEIQQMLI